MAGMIKSIAVGFIFMTVPLASALYSAEPVVLGPDSRFRPIIG